jgi:hypothetical protein
MVHLLLRNYTEYFLWFNGHISQTESGYLLELTLYLQFLFY